MSTSKIHSHAVWFNVLALEGNRLEEGFKTLWDDISRVWQVQALDGGAPDFAPWLRLGRNFYLVQLESHWTPQDLCGFFRNHGFLGAHDEIVVARLDGKLQVAHQGMSSDDVQDILNRWQEQARRCHLVHRAHRLS